MLSTKLKSIRFAGVLLAVAAICILFVFPVLKGGAAGSESGASPQAIKGYGQLANALSKCNTVNQVTEPTIKAPFSPAATLCVAGTLSNPADPTFDRPATQTTGTGIQAGCPLSGTAVRYDVYSFNLTACAAFPTDVTMTLCGPAGCLPTAGTDTELYLYRNVAAGDPLQANGGLPAVFNAASPCTNVRAGNDELNGGASSTSPTGNTCNQVTAVCLGACSVTTVSGFNRRLGSGRFTLVVAGKGNADAGPYNLHITAASAGCAVALAPTDATGNISGRVVTSTGSGIAKATLTVSGGGLGAPITLRTNSFGYYNFSDLPIGGTYIVTVSSKLHTFAQPTRAVNLEENAADIDFVSEQ